MMLRELAALAVRERLVPDPDFEQKPVPFVVYLGPGGEYLQIQRTQGAQTRAGKRDPGKALEIPRRIRKSVDITPEFAVEKAMYVFGVGDPGKDKPDRLRRCARSFSELMCRAAEATNDPGLQAVVKFLADSEASRRCTSDAGPDLAPGDLFAFHYAADPPDVAIHDRPAVRAWWKARRAEATKDAGTGQCLVTGQVGLLAPLHEKVNNPSFGEGLVSFISFNQNAFESFGLEGNENAPISKDVAILYAEALKRLMSAQWRDPQGLGTLPKQHLRFSDSTVAIFWAKSDNPIVEIFAAAIEGAAKDSPVDPASFFADPKDPRQIESLLSSPMKGRQVRLDDPSAFFAAVLTGAPGRISVRSWIVSTVAEAVRNLTMYFHDLHLNETSPLPVWRLLKSLAPQGDASRLSPELHQKVFESALFGRPFPRSLLSTATRRNALEHSVTGERAALIKAILCRELRRKESSVRRLFPELKEVTPSMDSNNRTTAYSLGRLLAVLDRMQALAIGPDAGVVDRYYGAASSTPQTVFPRLLRGYVHHKKKVMDSKPGAAVNTDKLLAETLAPFRAAEGGEPRNFPMRLSLEEQGLFALGFYHQRADFYRKSEEKE